METGGLEPIRGNFFSQLLFFDRLLLIVEQLSACQTSLEGIVVESTLSLLSLTESPKQQTMRNQRTGAVNATKTRHGRGGSLY